MNKSLKGAVIGLLIGLFLTLLFIILIPYVPALGYGRDAYPQGAVYRTVVTNLFDSGILLKMILYLVIPITLMGLIIVLSIGKQKKSGMVSQ